MGHKEIYAGIREVVPCVHMAWPVGSAPELPWAVFYLDRADGMYADDTKIKSFNKWIVELYERTRDSELEEALEAAIEEKFGPFNKSETWVEQEGCIQVAYHFTEISKELNNG